MATIKKAERDRQKNDRSGYRQHESRYAALKLGDYGSENYHLFDPAIDRSKWTDDQLMTEAKERGAVIISGIPEREKGRCEAALSQEGRAEIEEKIRREYKRKLDDGIRDCERSVSIITAKPETQSIIPFVLFFCGFTAVIFFIMALK